MSATVGNDAVAATVDAICALDLARPVRVAVDGITAAGKTTFAGTLTASLRRRERAVIRVSMDGFHHPRAVRYRQGRGSADGYYEDAYDFDSVVRELLEPLGPGGDRRYRSAVIDLAADSPVHDEPVLAPSDAVLIVDGSFLQKPALRDHWDAVIYLQTSFAAAEERGARRDADSLGGLDAARAAFRGRYHAAQHRYLDECNPASTADIVIDVEDPALPRVVRSNLHRRG